MGATDWSTLLVPGGFTVVVAALGFYGVDRTQRMANEREAALRDRDDARLALQHEHEKQSDLVQHRRAAYTSFINLYMNRLMTHDAQPYSPPPPEDSAPALPAMRWP